MSATLGVGGAIGLPLSAAIIQFSSWRVLYYLCAAITLIVALPIFKFVPVVSATTKSNFDWARAIELGVGLIALMLDISKGSSEPRDQNSPWSWGSSLWLSVTASGSWHGLNLGSAHRQFGR